MRLGFVLFSLTNQAKHHKHIKIPISFFIKSFIIRLLLNLFIFIVGKSKRILYFPIILYKKNYSFPLYHQKIFSFEQISLFLRIFLYISPKVVEFIIFLTFSSLSFGFCLHVFALAEQLNIKEYSIPK